MIGLVAAVSVVWPSCQSILKPLPSDLERFRLLTTWLSQRLQSIDSEGQPLQMNLVAIFDIIYLNL